MTTKARPFQLKTNSVQQGFLRKVLERTRCLENKSIKEYSRRKKLYESSSEYKTAVELFDKIELLSKDKNRKTELKVVQDQ